VVDLTTIGAGGTIFVAGQWTAPMSLVAPDLVIVIMHADDHSPCSEIELQASGFDNFPASVAQNK
jgi:hypothetical protein